MQLKRPEDIAALIRDKRTNAGLTQAEFAKRIGISLRSMTSLERGEPGTAVAIVLRALNELDVALTFESERPITVQTRSSSRPHININEIVDD